MTTNKFLSILGITLCFAATAFAGSPKSESKSTAKAVTYWFPLTTDGSQFDNRTVSDSQTEPQCEGSSSEYCAVAIDESQVDIDNINHTATLKSGVLTPPAGAQKTMRDE